MSDREIPGGKESETRGLAVDGAGMKSILSSVPELSASNESKEMALLRDSFFDRLPDECKAESVKTAWQVLWLRAAAFLSPSQMNQLGKAFLYD
jgi:hypothetical protein